MVNKVVVRHLWKVFGLDNRRAADLIGQGLGKEDVIEQTGGVCAVQDVSFEVPEQQIFVVMGLSGSGKSTLIRCINRLFEPTFGTIEIDGEDITSANDAQLRSLRLNKLAMVFQHFALLPHKSVLENAAFGLKLRGVPQDQRRDKAVRALEAVGLGHRADSLPRELSGGMQQRVGIARALAVEPQVLLMDEPFSALDPLIRRDMQDELIALQRTFKTTIIFITHDLHEALKLGDQIAIMKDGAFVQIGGPQEIVTQPADDYVRAFVQDVDRARVLTVERVASPVEPLVIGRDDVASARRKLDALPVHALPVVDLKGRVLGFIGEHSLGQGQRLPLEALVEGDAATAREGTVVHEAFGQLSRGTPLAVLDEAGRVSGMVEPGAIFANLAETGGPSPTPPPNPDESGAEERAHG
jgi:glycine betaine/proline transport system ATP-binding protein